MKISSLNVVASAGKLVACQKTMPKLIAKACCALTVTLLAGAVQGQTNVLHFSFDLVGGGTVTNEGSGGSAMDGTLNGTATIVPGGMFGNALQITGANASDGSVRIANAVVPLNVGAGQPAWSFAIWFKTATIGGCYAYQGDGGWNPGNTSFYLTSGRSGGGTSGTHAGAVRNSQEWEEGTTDVNDGLWHHFVLTFDGTTKVMYLDGHVETFDENNWPGNGVGGQFWIGGNAYNGDGSVNLNGLIDEAWVFDFALTLSDVQKLYVNNSLTVSPVPVAVTTTPDRGLRGTVVTITATATPASGTVTNATANLSAFHLTNALQLVQQSPNVFTNSFTVPTNAPIGLQNLTVNVRDTEPLNGAGATNFYVLAIPPTNATVVAQLTSQTVHTWAEASFHFAATNDAPNNTNNAFFPMAYAWYTNGVLVSTNPMGPDYTFLTEPYQNNLPIQCIAYVNDNTNYYTYLTVTSAPVTLTLISGSLAYTNGLKREFFAGGTRANVEIGNVVKGVIGLAQNADTAGGLGNNYAERYSGYFIPPTSDSYVFFLASDDDCDLFLSTNAFPAHDKQLIAQETTWSPMDSWQTVGAGIVSQKRSDAWTNSAGFSPWATGIPLQAGVPYYIEAVHAQGVGGDNWALTYETETELTADPTQPINGSISRMTAASNNIVVVTWPGTAISIVQDLTPTNVTILEGGSTNFSFVATSDAEMAPAYTWYVAGTPYPGATGTNLALSSISVSYNNAQIYAVAYVPEGSLNITSRLATLHVTQAVHEPGYIFDERFDGKVVNDIITGNIGVPNFQMALVEWGISQDNAGGHNNFARRVSGYFKPPITTNYTFFVTSDDDSILFLSTDDTPGNKRQICSQGGWNLGGNWRWTTAAGGGVSSQTHSDTWSPDGGVTFPYTNGIPLTNGHRYYIEQDMHQGGGGANLAATYTYWSEPYPASGGGTETVLKGPVIEMNVPRCSFVAITQQPQNVVNAPLGAKVAFTANGTTDSQVTVGNPFGYEENFTNSHLLFQWFTNNVAVPGATSSKFLMGPVTSDMVGVPVVCQVRALGYTDNALTPIWSNSTSASIQSTVPAAGPSLRGHWISGAASLADTANVVAPGVYDGVPRLVTGTRFYYFTNDVPPGATAGAQSIRFVGGDSIIITNTLITDPGYVTDTFDGGLQAGATVMCWAKGWPGAWNPWVSKYGENGIGWQLRTFNAGPYSCWTIRGTGNTDDMQSSIASNDGQWHHYAGTWDGTSLVRNLYVDGNFAATAVGSSGTYTLAPNSELCIGDRDSGNHTYANSFTGGIYDVRIYNYAVAQADILLINHLPVPFTAQVSPGQLTLTWPVGNLLQATNVLGPWTTNSSVSPATIDTTIGPKMFFRVKYP